jgi:hypothetical protein
MIYMIVAFMLIQHAPLPPSIKLTDKNGVHIGNITVDGNRLYLRDLKEELYGTIVIERDGSRTAYSADGKVLHRKEASPK